MNIQTKVVNFLFYVENLIIQVSVETENFLKPSSLPTIVNYWMGDSPKR